MANPIIEYPMDIRNLSGMSTIVFTYSHHIAVKLRKMLSDNFQVIHHDLKIINEDDFDWLKEALFYSHVFIISDADTTTTFASGVALSLAMEQNPELILGLKVNPDMQSFLKNLSKCESRYFDHIVELANFIEAEQ